MLHASFRIPFLTSFLLFSYQRIPLNYVRSLRIGLKKIFSVYLIQRMQSLHFFTLTRCCLPRLRKQRVFYSLVLQETMRLNLQKNSWSIGTNISPANLYCFRIFPIKYPCFMPLTLINTPLFWHQIKITWIVLCRISFTTKHSVKKSVQGSTFLSQKGFAHLESRPKEICGK